MKKISIWLLIIFSTATCFAPIIYSKTALCEEAIFLRVIDEETILYADKNGLNPILYLPYTYYVKKLSNCGEYTHVECFSQDGYVALDGYVLTNKLFLDNTHPENPYLSQKVIAGVSCTLFLDYDLNDGVHHVFKGRELNFYGYYKSKSIDVCLVSHNGKIGYIEEVYLTPFEIPIHPNELTFIKKEEDENTPVFGQTSEQNSSQTAIKITIICSLIASGIIALFISFKPRKKTKKVEFYDENDYE